MTGVAGAVVVLTGLWLLAQGVAAITAREWLERFLLAFAHSAKRHYLEQMLRLVAGGGLIFFADAMKFGTVFRIFGWVIVVTSLGLLLIPWTWHRRFAAWVVPLVIRRLRFYALGSFMLGSLMLYAALAP